MRTERFHNDPAMDGIRKLSLFPKWGVIDTKVTERAMGRILKATVSLGNRYRRVSSRAVPVPQSIKDLSSDVFYSLYKAEPEVLEGAYIARFLNEALLRLLHSAPNFESLRTNTIANIPTALNTTSTIVAALMGDEAVVEAMQIQDKLEKLQEQLGGKEQQQRRQQQRQSGGGQGDQDQQDKKNKQLQEQIRKLKEQIDKMRQELEGRVQKITGSQLAQGMMANAVDEGQMGADEMSAMMTSWGIEPGEASYDDANLLNELAMTKEETLALIAEIGGRVAEVSAETLQSVRDSYVGAPEEPTYTRDILRMFPMERTYMAPRAPQFLRSTKVIQWAQRGVLGLRPKSEGKKRGALVIAVDGSSSMNCRLCTMQDARGDSVRLDRGRVAKILATGVARAMREDRFERRRFTIFTFSTDREEIQSTSSADDWRELLEWVSYDPNGGTDFDVAFDFALDEMEKFEQDGTLGADLLFISDGECMADDRTVKRLKEYRDRTGARVFYIQVSNEGGSQFSDHRWDLDTSNLSEVVDAHVVVSSDDDIDDVPLYLAQQVSAVFAQVG